MSSKRFSPTSSVLRSSRFFSLPPPLPRPDSATSAFAATIKVSPSATLPYPIQQAVTTPSSSLARGDWGLKRPLPLRATTRTSTPFFRFHAVDTREHVTDFDSAADLTVTLEKFQEFGIPVTTLRNRDSHIDTTTCTVFEPNLDITDPKAPRYDPQTGEAVQRWKFQGPWLAGMTEADFLHYFERELVGRKDEFREFIRRKASEKLARDQRQKRATAQGRGQGPSNSGDSSNVSPEVVTIADERLDPMISRLRTAFHPASDLAELLTEFLDLPSNTASTSHYADRAHRVSQGPPSTHPSAGLSYLRTDALLTNHPVFGPMSNPRAQKARILGSETRGMYGRDEKLGVGGLVAEKIEITDGESRERHPARESRPTSNTGDAQQVEKDRNLTTIGLTVPGGNKLWVEPKRASVDERGRIHLEVRTAKAASVDGRRGVAGSTGVMGALRGGPSAYLAQDVQYSKRPSYGSRADLAYASGSRNRGPSYGMAANPNADNAGDILAGIQKTAEESKSATRAPGRARPKKRPRVALGLEDF